MYSCDFSRSVGAGRATTRNTRGLTRSVIALMVPPLPAPSRPSKRMQTFRPFSTTDNWSLTNSTCRRPSSRSYFFRFSLPLASGASFLASVLSISVIELSHRLCLQFSRFSGIHCLTSASLELRAGCRSALSAHLSASIWGRANTAQDVLKRPFHALLRWVTKTAVSHEICAHACAACDRCRRSRDRAIRARYRQSEQCPHWMFADRSTAHSPL